MKPKRPSYDNHQNKTVKFRFYAELNDYLPDCYKQTTFSYPVTGDPSIGSILKSLGVPEQKVDLILVNGQSVSISHHLEKDDLISVYPMFERFEISELAHIRNKSLRKPRFVLDVHLGKLAKYMRMLGLDTHYHSLLSDANLIEISQQEKRVLLTRDKDLLTNPKITRGIFIQHTNPHDQIKEVLDTFDLRSICKPVTRCLRCNTILRNVPRAVVLARLPPKTKQYYQEFYICKICNKIFWKGSHYKRMAAFCKQLVGRI